MSAAPLSGIQHDLQSYMLEGDAAIEAHVRGSERVPVETRLRIYGDAYRARLIEGLGSNFPMLAKLLGPDDFATVANDYITAHDSQSFSIRWYGHELAQFLATAPDYSDLGLLADLAKWEWAMTETFDAADAEPLSVEALSRVPPDQWAGLRFEWHPSVRLLTLHWNAPQIWSALSKDVDRPAAAVSELPESWLLWRQDLQTFFRSVPEDEAVLIGESRQGRLFHELVARLCDYAPEEEAAARLASYVRGWVEAGLIARADVSAE
jgi:hypothetical protein